ncbi:MAG: peptide chain release factor 2 [Firmicutes bacterium]|nr:peptide chain release factor 2 [Bacillota bacterium]
MGGHFDIEGLSRRLIQLNDEMSHPNFYNDIKRSSEVNIEVSSLEKKINTFNEIKKRIEADLELIELVEPSEMEELKNIIEELELETYLSGKYDSLNCFLEIHAGAGGTESCDWTDMLIRMYGRFCEKSGYKYEEISSQPGEEAGLKSVMIKITGFNAFGYLKNESGVHRLVRISPFDSNARRHTSFASVNVTPEFKKVDSIEINEKDLKVDVFHSSGAGGQSVNTSNSAVRITHIPSKIVVSVQNERSQLKNKEIAMEILKSKLYAIELEKHENQINGFKKTDSINFGSQIRSYVLEPYKMVKDNRTNYENSSPDKILNGEIMEMLEYNLKNIK